MSKMYTRMGMAVTGAIGSYATGVHESKLAAMSQAYQNKMADISKAMSLNTMTANEINVRDAAIRASESIQIQAMRDKSEATVSAAAAGVTGSSVASAMRGLDRSKLQATAALKYRLKQQALADLNGRRNLHMSAAYGRNVSPLGRASVGAAMLGLGASMLDIYEDNTPST